ncbi:hypothetical protein [Desulfosporosinus nitroreducens]|nr:hypothetical protein [Desulfosporosinus nitroreducens]
MEEEGAAARACVEEDGKGLKLISDVFIHVDECWGSPSSLTFG